jgi:hypothetical protein
MSEKYVIKWASKVNGRTGHGTKVFNREEAERLADELNQEYPDIEHQVTPARAGPPPTEAESSVSHTEAEDGSESESSASLHTIPFR